MAGGLKSMIQREPEPKQGDQSLPGRSQKRPVLQPVISANSVQASLTQAMRINKNTTYVGPK
jgi:hypothetical protein